MAETLDAAPTTDLTYDSASWWKRLDAKGDWANTDEDHSIAIDVLGNDVGALGIVKVNDTKITADMPPVTLASGATVDLDGRTLIYDPNDKFEDLNTGDKAEDTFTYTVVGYGKGTDTANVDVTIAGENDDPGTNHPPVAVNDKAVLPELVLGEEGVPDPSTYPSSVEINVLANDKDPDGDPLKVATIAETKVDTDPTTDTPDIVTLDKGMATVKLNANGSLTYTEVYPDFQLELDGSGDVPIDPDPILPPQAVFYLETWPVDGFTYTVTDDKEAESNAATVTVYRQAPVLGTDLGAEPAGVLDPLDPLLA